MLLASRFQSSSDRVVRCAIVLAALAFASAWPLRAHPEIEDALARINAQIAASPADADLYVQRGELYARHEDWIIAEANFLRAMELSPNHPRLNRALGTVELATGRAAEARVRFDAAIAAAPFDAELLVLRARAHVVLKKTGSAVADFSAALSRITTPPPELFLERAALLAPAEAIRSLDEGIERLGPAITLHLRAVVLEESLGRIDAAADRINRIAEQSERKESWLKRRGDLLSRAGRLGEARASYAAALAAIAALPDWLRASPDALHLAAELTRLTGSPS
jgi:tetratricopeptide (TPR) repeat protein